MLSTVEGKINTTKQANYYESTANELHASDNVTKNKFHNIIKFIQSTKESNLKLVDKTLVSNVNINSFAKSKNLNSRITNHYLVDNEKSLVDYGESLTDLNTSNTLPLKNEIKSINCYKQERSGTNIALKKLSKDMEIQIVGMFFNFVDNAREYKLEGGFSEEMFRNVYLTEMVKKSTEDSLGDIGLAIYNDLVKEENFIAVKDVQQKEAKQGF